MWPIVYSIVSMSRDLSTHTALKPRRASLDNTLWGSLHVGVPREWHALMSQGENTHIARKHGKEAPHHTSPGEASLNRRETPGHPPTTVTVRTTDNPKAGAGLGLQPSGPPLGERRRAVTLGGGLAFLFFPQNQTCSCHTMQHL